jgi:hypothetical protein
MSETPPRGGTAEHATSTARTVLGLTCGLAVGVLTSVGQTYLDGALSPVVNSASAWLVAPFFVGSRMATGRRAAAAGLAVCVLQLVGYCVTSELRGFSAGGSIVVFWTACAFVGGPLFGAAGRLWRTRTDHLRGLGAAGLAAAFLAEGTWVYLHELRSYGSAALWIAIGALVALTMTGGPRGLRWLAATLPAALAGEVLLTGIYAQSF